MVNRCVDECLKAQFGNDGGLAERTASIDMKYDIKLAVELMLTKRKRSGQGLAIYLISGGKALP